MNPILICVFMSLIYYSGAANPEFETHQHARAKRFVLYDVKSNEDWTSCINSAGASSDDAKRSLGLGDFDFESATAKNMMLCIFKKWNAVTDGDRFNQSAFLNLVPEKKQEEFKEHVKQCVDETVHVNSAVAWNVGKCLSNAYFKSQYPDSMSEIVADCVKENGAEMYTYKRLRFGYFDFEDENVKKALLCSYKKLGVMTEDGKFPESQEITSKERATFKICSKQESNKPEEIAWKFSICAYHEYIIKQGNKIN